VVIYDVISRGFEDISTAQSGSFLSAASVSIDSFARRLSAKAVKKMNTEPEDDDDENLQDSVYNKKTLKAKYKMLKLETKKRIRKVSSSTTTSRKSSGGSVFSPRGSYSTYEDFFKMPQRQNSRETGNEEARIRLREAERERDRERERERGKIKENERKYERGKQDEMERLKRAKKDIARGKRQPDTQRSPMRQPSDRTSSQSVLQDDSHLGQSVNSSVSQSLNESGAKPMFALRIRKGFQLPIRRTWSFFKRISLLAEVSDREISEAGELHWQASYSASKPLKEVYCKCCIVC
jgi:hypothetical protein